MAPPSLPMRMKVAPLHPGTDIPTLFSESPDKPRRQDLDNIMTGDNLRNISRIFAADSSLLHQFIQTYFSDN